MRNQIILSALCLAVLLVPTVAYLANAQEDSVQQPSSTQSKVFELMRERRATLQQALEYQHEQFLKGNASFEARLETEIALAHADLDLAPTIAARQIVHERLIKQLRQQEEIAQAQFELGKLTRMEVFEAKAARLQAEINMLQDRGQ